MALAAIFGAAFGLLLLSGGAMVLVSTEAGLSREDERFALAPVASIPLGTIAKQGLTVVNVVMPDDARWQRIRRTWGLPEYVIAAVSSSGDRAYCLTDLKIGIALSQYGHPLQLEPTGVPHRYSSKCGEGSLKFAVVPGTEFEAALTSAQERRLPPGALVVLASWGDTKDKIVGDSIASETRHIGVGVSALGVLLLAFSAWLLRIALQPTKRLAATASN